MPRRPLPRRALAALALACAAAWPLAVLADANDREQPVNFSADRGDLNYETKVGKLDGNVVLTQGTITVRADRLTFRQNADNSIRVTASGNPVTFRQRRDGTDEYDEGFAQRIEYDGQQELLELFERALLKRGPDEIRSNYISYNAKTGLFTAEGRPDAPSAPGPGSRVRGTFQPREGASVPGLPGDKGAKPAAGKAGAKAPAKSAPAPVALKPAAEPAPK